MTSISFYQIYKFQEVGMNSIPIAQNDIQSPTDIRLLVNYFYNKARQDELLSPIFDHAISDWEQHLPTMYQFGERLLLGSTDYNGNLDQYPSFRSKTIYRD